MLTGGVLFLGTQTIPASQSHSQHLTLTGGVLFLGTQT